LTCIIHRIDEDGTLSQFHQIDKTDRTGRP